jgi:2-polyprenyl-3-methyl-5-hydroxy-6-metoxy-1,4-benzoquinol methylase
VQEYLNSKTVEKPEETYPLNLVLCDTCKLSQLDYIVDPTKVFPKQYPYRTGLTNMLIRNFQSLADTLENQGYFSKGDLVVDIGSNDGTLLKPFKARGAKVLGVEPTNAAKDANKSGIPTIQDFFAEKAVETIKKKHGHARIITATNVFAHINDTPRLVKNVKALMNADSVFVSESQYFVDTIEKTEFDCIYHEHLRFYTLKPFMHLMEKHGLSVIDAERISAAGGSIRIYVKKGKHPLSSRGKTILAMEKEVGVHDEHKLRDFASRVHEAKRDLLTTLIECKQKGSIAALGSPARANTLLGFTHIDKTLVDYAGEKTGSPKIGLFTPGTHIPVFDESKIIKEQPPFLLILSWHIGEELMKIMRAKGYKGSFIVPLPKPRIVKA